MSTRVPFDHLEPGMQIAQDIKDTAGRLLLPSGCTLEEKHFAVIRKWGITAVEIKDENEDEDWRSRFSEKEIAEAREAILPRFHLNDEKHPLMVGLIDYCVKLRLTQGKGCSDEL